MNLYKYIMYLCLCREVGRCMSVSIRNAACIYVQYICNVQYIYVNECRCENVCVYILCIYVMC